MNVLKFELRKEVKPFIFWAISIASLQLLLMSFFPALSKDAQMMDLILANYPEALLKAMGMGGSQSLSSIFGYLSFSMVFIQMCLAVQSAYMGFKFLSVEERERTADFLFSKPIGRMPIFIAKYSANALVLLLTTLITALSIWLSIKWFGEGKAYDAKTLSYLMLSLPFFQWSFFHMGMLLTVLLKKIKSPISFAMGFALGLYMLNAVRAIIGGTLLGAISPYYHFEVARITEIGQFDFSRASISLVFIALSLGVALPLYLKRNIQAL